MPNEKVSVSLDLDLVDFLKKYNEAQEILNKLKMQPGLTKDVKKEIDSFKNELDSLGDSVKKIGEGKISRSAFYKFKEDITKRVTELESRVEGLQDVLGETIKQLSSLGNDVDLSRAIKEFDRLKESILSCDAAIEEISKTTKGDVIVDVDGLQKTGIVIKDVNNAYKEIQKTISGGAEAFDFLIDGEHLPLLNNYIDEFRELVKVRKEALNAYEKAPEGDDLFEFANFQKADLEMREMAIRIKNLWSAMEGMENANFPIEKLASALNLAKGYSADTEQNFEQLTKATENTLKNVEKVQAEYKETSQQIKQEVQQTNEVYEKRLKLADLLDKNVINIEIKTSSNKLEEQLNAQIEKLQAELNAKALEVPIKIVVGNSTSDTLLKQARKSGEDMFVDTEKVVNRSLKDAVRRAKEYINEAIDEIKKNILSVFSEKIPVEIELDTKALEVAKESLTSITKGGKFNLTDNLKEANETVKQLRNSLKEVLNLQTDTQRQTQTKSKYGGTETKLSLQQKINQYEKDIEEILSIVQKKVDTSPLYISLDIKPSEITSINKKIQSSLMPESLDVTSSLKEAQQMADKITSTLKVLDGFKTNISGTLVSGTDLTLTNQEIGVTIGELRIISDNLLEIKTLLEQIGSSTAVGRVEDKIQQTSIDISGITDKLDELMATSKALISDLRLDFSVAEVSIKELGNALANVILEANSNSLESKWFNIAKAFRQVSDEAGNIDLRKSRKEVEALVSAYEEYVKLGGRYSFDFLTDNQKTLTKLQNVSDKSFGGLSVSQAGSVTKIYESYEKILESLNSIDGKLVQVRQDMESIKLLPEQIDGFERLNTILNNIVESLKVINGSGKKKNTINITKNDATNFEQLSKSLSEINELTGVGQVFAGLSISKPTLKNISELATILPQVAEGLKNLDSYDSIGFLNQLSELAIASDGLDKLARVLSASSEEIQNALSPSISSTISTDSFTNEFKEIDKLVDKLSNRFSNELPKGFTELLSTINQIKLEIIQIGDISIDSASKEDVERYKQLYEQLRLATEQLEEFDNIAKKSQITKMILRINKFLEQSKNLTDEEVKALKDLINRASDINITKQGLEEIGAEFNRIQANAIAAGHTTSSFFDAVKNKLKYKWAETFAMFFSFYDIIRYVRELSSTITELNSNLIELAKVSDASIGELYSSFSDFYDIAKQTGGTINDIISATADWSRNGYNLVDSKELARLSSIFQNIGDGMSADQSNEYLVSILKGFNLQAKDTISIMDAINNVSNNAASSVSNIGEALERSSSAFGAANTSLNQSVALLTTANEVLQNPETVGTAFKSMSARLRSSTTELEELGEEATLTTSKLRALVQSLTGVDIQEDENNFKSIYDILLEIGKEWQNLTDIEQASLSEALFGKRNAQVGFAILNNIKRLEEVYALAQDSEGSAMKEQEKYLEGVQYRIDTFNASLENLSNTFMSSDFLKGVIGAATTFLDIVNELIDTLGTIPTLFTTIAVVGTSKFNLIGNSIRNAFSTTNMEKTISPILSKEGLDSFAASGNKEAVEAILKSYKDLKNGAKDLAFSEDQLLASLQANNTQLYNYVTTTKVADQSLKGYQKAVRAAKLEQIAFNAVSAVAQGIIMAFASIIITQVIGAISDWIHKTDKLIEAGEKAKESIANINDELKKSKDLVNDSGKRFAELAQGVNQLTGENISLSNSDYQEFLDISNELAEVFPSLSRHYDENGNAIVDLNGDVATITKSLRELYQVQEDLARQKILEELPDVIEGAESDVWKQYKDDIQEVQDELDALSLRKDTTKEVLENYNDAFTVLNSDNVDGFRQKLHELNIDFKEMTDGDYTTFTVIDPGQVLNPDNVQEILSVFDVRYGQLQSQMSNIIQSKNKAFSSAISSSISAWLFSPSENYEYLQYSAELQSQIQDIINNINWNDLDWNGQWDTLEQLLSDNVLDVFKDSSQRKQLELAFSLTTESNKQSMSVQEYLEQLGDIKSITDQIEDDTIREAFLVTLGIQFDENDKPIYAAANNAKEKFKKAFGEGNEKVVDEIVNSLTVSELDVLSNLNIDWKKILDVDGYKKAVDEMKEYQEQGNVDLFNRPTVSGTKMNEAGWDVEPDSTATVYSSAFDIKDKSGNTAIVHITPILPNGNVLSPEELEQYVYENLQGANNILEADDKGIVLKVDENVVTDSFGNVTEKAWQEAENWDIHLHQLQEKYYLEGEKTTEEYISQIRNAIKEASSIPFEINFDEKTLENTTSGIKEIQSVYQSLFDKMNEGKAGTDLAFLLSDINALKNKLVDTEGNVVDLGDAWTNFAEIMTDGTHSFEEMESALNEVLTAYVDTTINIENFDEAQAKLISTQLQLAGVTKESADAYVQSQLDIANAIKIASNAGYELDTITSIEIQDLVDLGLISEDTAQRLAELPLKKQIANGIVINTTGDINNLIALADAAGIVTTRLSQLAEAKQLLDIALASGDVNAALRQRVRIKGLTEAAQKDINEQLAALKNEQKLNQDSSKLSSKGGGSSKEEDLWKKAYEKELAALDHLHEMELISDIKYYEEREKLNDKYFKDNEKYTEDYEKNLEEIYKGFQSAYKQFVDDMSDYWSKALDSGAIDFKEYCQQMESMLKSLHDAGKISDATYYSSLSDYYGNVVSNYDKAINAAQRVIKKKIEQLEKEKEALDKAYDEKKDAIQARIDKYEEDIDARNKQIKVINKQIDALNDEIDLYQKEIDKINEANEERKAALDMQKALYNLNRAENQRTNMVYKSEQGFVYEADAQAIKDAEEEVTNLEHEAVIRKIEKTISTLQDSVELLQDDIENLEDEIDSLNENIDELELEIQRLDEELDFLKDKIDEQIDAFEEYSDTIGHCADAWAQAQEDMVAASIWGSDWQNQILSQDTQLVQDFESMYVQAQKNQADAALQAAKDITDAYNQQIRALNAWKEAQASAGQTSEASYTAPSNANVKGTTTPKKDTKYTPKATSKISVPKSASTRSVYVYGHGTDSAAPGWHEVAEDGEEIILDNYGNAYVAKGHQLHKFEGGEKVYDSTETQELLRGKYLPIESILPEYASMVAKMTSANLQTTNPSNAVVTSKRNVQATKVDNSITITVGDIHVTEVDNGEQVAKAITNRLPNALLQELNRK